MTTPQELKDRYTGLYDYMAQSRDPKNTKAFGCVMTEMMDYLIQTTPAVAEEMIDKLEAIKWKQDPNPARQAAILYRQGYHHRLLQDGAEEPEGQGWRV